MRRRPPPIAKPRHICDSSKLDLAIFEESGAFLIFDIQSCILMQGDALVRDILTLASSTPPEHLPAVLSRRYPGKRVREAFRELEFCVEHGLLHAKRSSDRNEDFSGRVDEELPLNLLSLDISGSCNLACSYCFEKQDKTRVKRMMTGDVGRAAVDWFLEHSGDLPSVTIRFFGGEPLLNLSGMEYVASYATASARRIEKEVRFVLSTNGTLLSRQACEFIGRYRVGTCISVDGPKGHHDAYRCSRSGRGSFAQVARGVRNLLAMKPISIWAQGVVTRRSYGDLKTLARFFREMGFTGVYLGLVDGNGRSADYSLSAEDLRRLHADYVSVLESCMVEAQPCRFDLSGHEKILRRLYEGERAFYGCPTYAGVCMFHVDPEGTVYPCYRLRSSKDLVGYVAEGIREDRLRRTQKSFLAENVLQNRCRRCWARFLCGGMCPARERRQAPEPDSCPLCERMELNLRLYARLWAKHRPLLDSSFGASSDWAEAGRMPD